MFYKVSQQALAPLMKTSRAVCLLVLAILLQ
jgi:hypothetical protein